MAGLRIPLCWIAMLSCLASLACLKAGESAIPLSFSPLTSVEDVPDAYQSAMRAVLDKPTLRVRGPVETFRCKTADYRFLLDHPDRAVSAWLRLGAKCSPIDDRGNGRFGSKDDQGSDVSWETVVDERNRRIWYASGIVKPGALLPSVPVKAIVVLHIIEGRDAKGRTAIRHQAELILHTNNKAAALATRILGASAPRLAEQYVGQIQAFFAALAWYLEEHPERRNELVAE